MNQNKLTTSYIKMANLMLNSKKNKISKEREYKNLKIGAFIFLKHTQLIPDESYKQSCFY